MSEYLIKIKSISDQLAAAGRKVDNEDLVLYVLNGLGPEYASFVTSISTSHPGLLC